MSSRTPKPFLGMLFKCCNVYLRIYLNAQGDAYQGRCPRCGAPVTIHVAEGGSGAKFWSAH